MARDLQSAGWGKRGRSNPRSLLSDGNTNVVRRSAGEACSDLRLIDRLDGPTRIRGDLRQNRERTTHISRGRFLSYLTYVGRAAKILRR